MEEKKERSFYTISVSTVVKNGKKKIYYSYNRSGSQASGVRAPKYHGSCKMGSHCTATIEVIEGEQLLVTHFRTHIGHEMELKHLSLSQSEKEELSRKLTQGISFERCLKDVKVTIGNSIERIHLLNRQDLHNILRVAVLNTAKRHENDAISVALFAAEMSELRDHSPVLFYKSQDTIHEDLNQEDFMIVIMTLIQKDMFVKFGPDKICIDSTHGTNVYDFHLTTIVVVDEFGLGFPAHKRTTLSQLQIHQNCNKLKADCV